MIGSGKEFVGNVIGSPSLANEGRRQNEQGQGQEAVGQLKDYSGGVVDRITGTVGAAVAGFTGNTEARGKFDYYSLKLYQ